MFEILQRFAERPVPFSRYTTDALWTDSHVSEGMLRCHRDESNDLASRRPALIEGIVDWFDRRIGLDGKRVCDIGCGPGLYAMRMARRGASVTGVDFSSRSIDHARAAAVKAGVEAAFIVGDYLKEPIPGGQDLVCLIYGDMCTLSPENRRTVVANVRAALKPGGVFIFDLYSEEQFAECTEFVEFSENLMDGFWSAVPYFGFRKMFVYQEERVTLDRYLIVEAGRTREIFNWMQYYSIKRALREFNANGFVVEGMVDVLTGAAWTPGPSPFAVIARAV